MDAYRTVGGRGVARFSVRGSTFAGHVAPAGTPDDAEAYVAAIRADHPDATHVVPAYRVRVDGMLREHADDDGEPGGSAGSPALTVLQRRDLENVVAAVVRRYGGTDLGVGGLARAYGRAVGEAVDDAGVVEERPHERLAVAAAYDDSGTVRGILESEGLDFEADYGERVAFDVRVPRAASADLQERLRSATSGRVEIGESEARTE